MVGERTSLVAQLVKNLPAMQETQVQSLGWEDPLEMEMATTPIFLLGNPMDRGDWRATVHGVTKELYMTLQLNNIIYSHRI